MRALQCSSTDLLRAGCSVLIDAQRAHALSDTMGIMRTDPVSLCATAGDASWAGRHAVLTPDSLLLFGPQWDKLGTKPLARVGLREAVVGGVVALTDPQRRRCLAFSLAVPAAGAGAEAAAHWLRGRDDEDTRQWQALLLSAQAGGAYS